MNTNQVSDFQTDSPVPRWKIEWWGLMRGLVVLFSAFLGVTVIYYLILTVFRG